MTVKELKELLADVPDDVEVAFCSEVCDIYNNASEVTAALRLTNLELPGDDRVILVGR